MGALRKRIGFLWPADGLNDAEYLRFVPPNVDWLVARYDAGTETEELTEATLSAYASPEVMTKAAHILKAASPDVVACGDHAASFIAGEAGAVGMAKAVKAALGCSVTTMADATQDALAALGARKIALVSPYTRDVTVALCDTLQASGFTQSGQHVVGASHEEEIGTRSAAEWLPDLIDFAKTLPPATDAVFLAGGGMCFAEAIEIFEAETGIPVVTAPGALVRKACALAGVAWESHGLGQLYRPTASQSVKVLTNRQSSGTKSFVVSDAPPVFVSGAGPWLISETRRAYLDFASGSGTTAIGHGHAAIKAAQTSQHNSGITHLGPHFHAPVQARLYDLLADALPPHLSRFHPSVSGAEATEVALKAAMHATGARHFIGFDGGYHGRTFGALSVSGARGKNEKLRPFCPSADILPFPVDAAAGAAVAARIKQADQPLAGVVIEPVQATAGFRSADPEALQAIVHAAQDADVPLIVDEVFTGFGRLGAMFSFERFGIKPDLVILAKSFGGGMPGGLVAGTEALLGTWPQGVQTSTFQLHPMAAATAEAFLSTLIRDDLVARVQELEPMFEAALAPLLDHPAVQAVRGQGAFWAVAMAQPEAALATRRAALDLGLITWECGVDGEAIGLVPPLIIDQTHIDLASARLHEALRTACG